MRLGEFRINRSIGLPRLLRAHLPLAAFLLGILFSQVLPAWSGPAAEIRIDGSASVPISGRLLGHNWCFAELDPGVDYCGVMRGVAGGLAAEMYDWQTLAGDPNGNGGTTLDFLQAQAAAKREPVITVNMRGIPSDDQPAIYRDTSIESLEKLAADWVVYANRALVAPTGDRPRYEALFSRIKWRENPVQAAVATRRVDRWQIGNEPSGEAGKLPGGRAFLLHDNPDDYVKRYLRITGRMLAEDPKIRVGPVFSGQDIRALPKRPTVTKLLESKAQIDFIHYQPYGHIESDWPDEESLRKSLVETASYLVEQHDAPLKKAIRAAGRDPGAIEIGVSEIDCAGWNQATVLASNARALGLADQILTCAGLGYDTAMVWNRISGNGARWPTLLVMQRFRRFLGTRYLGAAHSGDIAVHATADEGSGSVSLWLINYNPATTSRFTLAGPFLEGRKSATRSILGRNDGSPTRLVDFNDALNPRRIDWGDPTDVSASLGEEGIAIEIGGATMQHILLGNSANEAGKPPEKDQPIRGTAPPSGLVARWKGDISPDGSVEDTSGNGHHASIRGTVKNPQEPGPPALVFDGASWLEVPNLPNLPFGPGHSLILSFEFRTSSRTAGAILDRGAFLAGGPMREISVRLSPAGAIEFQTGLLVRKFQLAGGTAGSGFNDGKWHRAVISLDDGTATVEVDGREAGRWQTDWNLCHPETMLVGARRNSRFGRPLTDLMFRGELRRIEIRYGHPGSGVPGYSQTTPRRISK